MRDELDGLLDRYAPEAGELWLSALPDPAPEHEFSPEFRRKVEKLLLRQKDSLLDMLNCRCPHLNRKDAEYIFEYILGGFIYLIRKWFEEDMVIPLDTLEKNLSQMTEAILKSFSGTSA